jgi:hypothetical protein
MNFISNFEKILQNTKTEELVLDDIVGDILKISIQYTIILLIGAVNFDTLLFKTSIDSFKEGSNILTNKGYKPIQELRKGDLVKTLNHNYKAIDMIGKREIYHLRDRTRVRTVPESYARLHYTC